MVVNKPILSDDDEIRGVDQTEYFTLVGALGHVAQYTREAMLVTTIASFRHGVSASWTNCHI